MYRSEVMNETVMETSDYPLAEQELDQNGWVLSTYALEGSTRLSSHKLCDIWVEVVSPSGERWTDNRGPIFSADGLAEAEAALKTAKWVKAHWDEVSHN
ncbi:MAG: hypothetical protein Q4A17_08300 [Thermoguttaceae bacterium]|nr:hypothetical protein [Thermoguttaceae bacterium]